MMRSKLDPAATYTRGDFFMELIDIWQNTIENFRNSKHPEAKYQVKRFEVAIDALKSTYSVNELCNLKQVFVVRKRAVKTDR